MSTSRTSIDWVTVLLYLALVTVGWLAVYTADFQGETTSIFNLGKNYGKQLVFLSMALVIAFIIQILDTRFYTAFAYAIYAGVLLVLVFVLLFGSEISGSKSWIRLGLFNVQPSEFAKFATALALAKYLSGLNVSLHNFKQQFMAGVIIAIPILLILLQKDAGTAIVFSAFAIVLYREGLSGTVLVLGFFFVLLFILSLLFTFEVLMAALIGISLIFLVRKRGFNIRELLIFTIPVVAAYGVLTYADEFTFLLLLFAAGLLFLLAYYLRKKQVFLIMTILLTSALYSKGVSYVFNNILLPHQQNRITVVLGLNEDKRGIGYNLNQSKIAIGSGGIWGKGFKQGTQNKGNFVPELNTDFIFCTVGEEFGFVGSAVLISLFLALLLRLVFLAERQKSRFSAVYAYGVAALIFQHFMINIGMTIGLMPIIGIPLPYISYGGSSLIGFTVLLFILVKLDSERYMFLR